MEREMIKKVTVDRIGKMKGAGEKICALTAYDYAVARAVDEAGVDIALVGDSLGMVFRGEENTLKVTVDDMAYHTRAVRRGVRHALLVTDMPFLSYHVGVDKAVENAGRLIAEGAEAVKLEGCDGVTGAVRAMLCAGVPVMGHIGMTPQSIHKFGGFKIQGRQSDTAKKLIDEAAALESAGVFAMVLECMPADLAAYITGELKVPTIGIGAGPGCDGQILVTQDMLGLNTGVAPKFVKRYADLPSVIGGAVTAYIDETRSGAFPAEEHCYEAAPRRLKAM